MKKLFTLMMMVVTLLSFSMGASAQNTKGDLTSSKAFSLVLSARVHYWDAMNGHIQKIKNASCSSNSFSYHGKDYRYLCSDLGTKKKFITYMNEVFTRNAIDRGIKKYKFTEVNGKLAQPNADSGSLLEWNKAKGKLIYQREGIRLYEYTVPYGEKVQFEKRKVTFVKVGSQWQINAIDAVK
jgi:hypothetical protein